MHVVDVCSPLVVDAVSSSGTCGAARSEGPAGSEMQPTTVDPGSLPEHGTSPAYKRAAVTELLNLL